jgi:hypothetical protein
LTFLTNFCCLDPNFDLRTPFWTPFWGHFGPFGGSWFQTLSKRRPFGPGLRTPSGPPKKGHFGGTKRAFKGSFCVFGHFWPKMAFFDPFLTPFWTFLLFLTLTP